MWRCNTTRLQEDGQLFLCFAPQHLYPLLYPVLSTVLVPIRSQHCWQLWHLLYGNVCSGVPTFLTNAPSEPLLVPNDHALGSSGRKSSVNEPETCFYPWGRITWWKQGCLFLKVQRVPWLSLGVLHRYLCNCWKEISLNRSDKTVGTFTGENKQTDLKSCRTGKAYHVSHISSTYFT